MSLCANTKTYDFVDCLVKSMYIYIYLLQSFVLSLSHSLVWCIAFELFVCNGRLVHLESQQESPWSQPNDDASTHDARTDGTDDDASDDDATPWCRGIR